MFEEIGRATRSVHFETFLWKDGMLGRRLVDALTQRSRAGVTVRVLVDATGGKEMGEAAVGRLEEAGCKFDTYHPKRLRNIGVLNERDHRKITVLDGRTALVGGHCIVDSWLGDAQDGEHFRDLSVRLRGPIVHAIQSAFSENWVEETGELFVGEDVFPELRAAGAVAIHVARVKPEGSAPAVKILHHLAICCARERIWIQNPYFLPDEDLLELILNAAERGVRVRIMLPGADGTDNKPVFHASHTHYPRLLGAGVELFHYHPGLLHQKVLVIDGLWSHVGSTNFDSRSFEINEEVSVGVLDPGVARTLTEAFERDLEDSSPFTLEDWNGERSVWHRLTDWAAHLAHEQM